MQLNSRLTPQKKRKGIRKRGNGSFGIANRNLCCIVYWFIVFLLWTEIFGSVNCESSKYNFEIDVFKQNNFVSAIPTQFATENISLLRYFYL